MKNLVLCSLFITLITVGAFIKIPVPFVPFTLQFLFTTLAGILLGKRLGATSVLVYLLLGLLGLPLFAEGGGIGYLAKPSFGYLIGFAVGAFVSGAIAHGVGHPSYKRLLVASFAGLCPVYLIGIGYFYLVSTYLIAAPLALGPLLLYSFVLAVPGDIALCFTAATLAKRLLPSLRQQEATGTKQPPPQQQIGLPDAKRH